MFLAIPFKYKEREIREVNLKSLTTGDIKSAQGAKDYVRAMLELVKSLVDSFVYEDGEISTKETKEAIIRHMPFPNSEQIMFMSVKDINGSDAIDAAERCSRCGAMCVYEGGHISDLGVNKYDGTDLVYTLHLEKEIEIKSRSSNGDVNIEMSIDSLTFRMPTVNDYIEGSLSGDDNIGVLASAIIAINGTEVDAKKKRIWGTHIINKLPVIKSKDIGEFINGYGMQRYVMVKCHDCGKDVRVPIKPVNFFDSGNL